MLNPQSELLVLFKPTYRNITQIDIGPILDKLELTKYKYKNFFCTHFQSHALVLSLSVSIKIEEHNDNPVVKEKI